MELKIIGDFAKVREIETVIYDVLIQVDKTNINVFNCLQPLSCTKIVIGDYVCKNKDYGDRELFSKNLFLKTGSRVRRSILETVLSEDKKQIKLICHGESGVVFRNSNGNLVVKNDYEDELIILSDEEFFERFKVIE